MNTVQQVQKMERKTQGKLILPPQCRCLFGRAIIQTEKAYNRKPPTIIALEDENQRLKAQLAEMKTNAINWCMLAKSYQQDRNYIGVQLSELEVKLAQAQRRPGSSSDGSSSTKGTTTTTTTTSLQTTAEKGGAGGDTTVDDIMSQSISQLLDTV